jgi:hypothetical protein
MPDEQNPNSGASTDGLELSSAQENQDPVDAGQTSDGTATESQESSTPADEGSDTRDVFAEIVGDDHDDDKDAEQPEPAADDRKPETDADAPKGDEEKDKPQEQKPKVEDNPNDPPRRRIKNLEKIRDDLTEKTQQMEGAFRALNQGFVNAGLDPQRGMDELHMFARAKSGDAQAKAELAKRYGIEPTPAPPAETALTAKQKALLEDYGLDEEFTALAKAPETTQKPESKQPPAEAPKPAQPAAHTRDELEARETMSLTASAVRRAEPEHAQKILEKAASILQTKVAKYRSSPGAWGELFREAVGEATAAVKAPARPAQRVPQSLRGTNGSGGTTTKSPKNGIDAEFPGLFD